MARYASYVIKVKARNSFLFTYQICHIYISSRFFSRVRAHFKVRKLSIRFQFISEELYKYIKINTLRKVSYSFTFLLARALTLSLSFQVSKEIEREKKEGGGGNSLIKFRLLYESIST